jgi:hypothetical protein
MEQEKAKKDALDMKQAQAATAKAQEDAAAAKVEAAETTSIPKPATSTITPTPAPKSSLSGMLRKQEDGAPAMSTPIVKLAAATLAVTATTASAAATPTTTATTRSTVTSEAAATPKLRPARAGTGLRPGGVKQQQLSPLLSLPLQRKVEVAMEANDWSTANKTCFGKHPNKCNANAHVMLEVRSRLGNQLCSHLFYLLTVFDLEGPVKQQQLPPLLSFPLQRQVEVAVDATPIEMMVVAVVAHGLEVPRHHPHVHKQLVVVVVLDPCHSLQSRMLVVAHHGLVNRPLLNLNPIKEVVSVVVVGLVAAVNNNPFVMDQWSL